MTDSEVQTIATQIFIETLGSLGFERVEVTSGPDQDGDRSFFLEAFFKRGTRIERVGTLVDARGALRDVMLDRGEERFPYVSYRIPDESGFDVDDVGEANAPASGA